MDWEAFIMGIKGWSLDSFSRQKTESVIFVPEYPTLPIPPAD